MPSPSRSALEASTRYQVVGDRLTFPDENGATRDLLTRLAAPVE